MVVVLNAASAQIVVYANQLGSAWNANTLSISTAGLSWTSQSWPTTYNLRIGCTGADSLNYFGYPADYHFTAFYNTALTSSDVQKLFAAGLPNSLPSVAGTPPYTFFLYEDATSPTIPLTNSNAYYDADGNIPASFKLYSIPSVGSLIRNGVAITASTPLPVTINTNGGDTLTYTYPPFTFSEPYNTAVCNTSYSSFTYTVTDGIADGSTPSTSPTFYSPIQGTANICVKEINHPPVDLHTSSRLTVMQAGTTQPVAFQVKCQDPDVSYPYIGLAGIRILSQANTTLGVLSTNPTNGGTLAACNTSVTSFPYNITATTTPLNNTDFTGTLCYTANNLVSPNVIVGYDTIYYQCYDLLNATSPTYSVTIEIRNALLPGCGTPSTIQDSAPCTFFGIQDTPWTLALQGSDSVSTHNASYHVFRVDSLPRLGNLTDPANPNATITPGYTFFLNTTTNAGMLTYLANPRYFNAYCNNSDPIPTTYNATCPMYLGYPGNTPIYSYDLIGNPLRQCATPSTGCPDTFSFSFGYTSTGILNDAVFGFSLVNGVHVFTVNTWDGLPTPAISGPANLTNVVPLTAYIFGGNESSITITTLDGDVRRIFYFLGSADPPPKFNLQAPLGSSTFDTELTAYGIALGSECINTACLYSDGQLVYGLAYPSQINYLFSRLSLVTLNSYGNDTLWIALFDPPPHKLANSSTDYSNFAYGGTPSAGSSPNKSPPGGLSVAAFEQVPAYYRTLLIPVTFGPAGNGDLGAYSIGIALIAGLAAMCIIVLLACIAAGGCLIRGARAGERYSVWIVRNVLCTEVSEEVSEEVAREAHEKPDVRTLAVDGRKSLVAAVHLEHERLVRIVYCALLARRVCWCCVKFDTKNVRVPDEETLVRAAMYQEEDLIAQAHKPTDQPPAQEPKRVDDVERLAPEDDDIWDWEKHIDEKSGRAFYYNAKTGKSQWNPPEVRVHRDRTSVKDPAMLTPKPPSEPRPKDTIDDQADRVKKA